MRDREILIRAESSRFACRRRAYMLLSLVSARSIGMKSDDDNLHGEI